MKALSTCLFLFFVTVGFAATATTEIEALLSYLGRLEGATFIRNGGSHAAGDAVAHLRLKWEKQAKKIATAEDFVALCGSKSSTSGERYRIRFKDGTDRYCDEVLLARLTVMRGTK
ncbi:MAG: DUF5329 family protein [Opitutaceae bacterium]